MKVLRDRAGKTLATENDVSPYRAEIRDRAGRLLGYHNPQAGPDGQTYDRSGRVVGSGDQRGRFIADGNEY